MNETIEKLLSQTRPVTKGPRVRCKSKKSMGDSKAGRPGNDIGAPYCGSIGMALGLQSALSGMAQSAASQEQASAMAQAQRQQGDLLREQYARQQSGLGGLGDIGQAAGPALSGLVW